MHDYRSKVLLLCRAIVASPVKSRRLVSAVNNGANKSVLRQEDTLFLAAIHTATNRKELYDMVRHYRGPYAYAAYNGIMAALNNYYLEAQTYAAVSEGHARRLQQLQEEAGKTEVPNLKIW